ncbi:hypothetical protein AN416_28980 [Paraburkholderia caribensis]|nr:hypothetical protein AN416_28980 [Paraburkholderia caribensis]
MFNLELKNAAAPFHFLLPWFVDPDSGIEALIVAVPRSRHRALTRIDEQTNFKPPVQIGSGFHETPL